MPHAKSIHIIGGAGLMGSGIVHDLLSDRSIVEIGIVRVFDASDRNRERLARDLADARLSVHALDVSDRAALAAALAGADICINAVPTMLGFQMEIFEAALLARVPYLDLGPWHLHGAPEAG